MIRVNVGRGAFALIGAKSDPRYINSYYSCIRKCTNIWTLSDTTVIDI